MAVEMKTEAYGDVDSYGIAFTPLFLCIGLWVGALMCYVVIYYDQKHRFAILDHDYKNKFLQNACISIFAKKRNCCCKNARSNTR